MQRRKELSFNFAPLGLCVESAFNLTPLGHRRRSRPTVLKQQCDVEGAPQTKRFTGEGALIAVLRLLLAKRNCTLKEGASTAYSD